MTIFLQKVTFTFAKNLQIFTTMSATKKITEAIFSLSLIIIIIAVTSLNFPDVSYENNKLSYFEMGISSFFLLLAMIIKFREIRTNI